MTMNLTCPECGKASLRDGGLSLGGVATSSTRVSVGMNILSEFVASMYFLNTT